MKYKEIVKNKEINAYLEKGNANLGQLGFTDHSQAHCVQVAHQAGKILERFGYSEHEVELVKIAGYMHDIGNAINRTHHAEYAFEIFIVRNVDEIEVADNSVFHILELTPLHSRTGVTAVCVLLASHHVIDTDTGLATTFPVFQTKVVMSVYSQLGSAVATFQHRLSDDR